MAKAAEITTVHSIEYQNFTRLGHEFVYIHKVRMMAQYHWEKNKIWEESQSSLYTRSVYITLIRNANTTKKLLEVKEMNFYRFAKNTDGDPFKVSHTSSNLRKIPSTSSIRTVTKTPGRRLNLNRGSYLRICSIEEAVHTKPIPIGGHF